MLVLQILCLIFWVQFYLRLLCDQCCLFVHFPTSAKPFHIPSTFFFLFITVFIHKNVIFFQQMLQNPFFLWVLQSFLSFFGYNFQLSLLSGYFCFLIIFFIASFIHFLRGQENSAVSLGIEPFLKVHCFLRKISYYMFVYYQGKKREEQKGFYFF